jgi:hypothetical protein
MDFHSRVLMSELQVILETLDKGVRADEQYADELYVRMTDGIPHDELERQQMGRAYWSARARAELAASVAGRLTRVMADGVRMGWRPPGHPNADPE